MENVKSCLTTAIITSEVYQNGGSHDELMEFSFNSHTVCYNDNKFCIDILMSYHNLKCLLEIFNFKDFLSKHAIKQVLPVNYHNYYRIDSNVINKINRSTRLLNAVFQLLLKNFFRGGSGVIVTHSHINYYNNIVIRLSAPGTGMDDGKWSQE